jgi:DNA-directed RNA polymerase beta subunit
MEVTCLLSAGGAAHLKECMMEKADKYQYDIDNSTGNIAITNKKNGIYQGYTGEGVIPSHDFSRLETPYAFKLMTQELMTMGLKPEIYTHDDYLSEGDEDTYEDVEVEMNEEEEF